MGYSLIRQEQSNMHQQAAGRNTVLYQAVGAILISRVSCVPIGTMYAWVEKAKVSSITTVADSNGAINNVNVKNLIDENRKLKKCLRQFLYMDKVINKALFEFEYAC